MNNAEEFFKSLNETAAATGLVGRPEDLYFEAKRCSVPLSESDKDHLAEALSGFANGDGGTLVYGLVAAGGNRTKPDVVTGVDRIRKLSLLHGEVTSLVGQFTQPPVEAVQVVQRNLARTEDEGFLLVYVPRSDRLPHRSVRDREYYRRYGCGFYRLEHYDLAECFGRRRSPVLKLWIKPIRRPVLQQYGVRIQVIEVLVGIENVGRGIAKFPALKLIDTPVSSFGLDRNGRVGLPERGTLGGQHLFGGGADYVIYPDSVLEVTTIRFEKGEEFQWESLSIKYEIVAEDCPLTSGTIEVRKSDFP